MGLNWAWCGICAKYLAFGTYPTSAVGALIRVYIVWVKGIRVTFKISAVSAFRGSSHELAKSRDESRNTMTLQLLACAPHVTFVGCTTREPSREINFLSNLHQLNTTH